MGDARAAGREAHGGPEQTAQLGDVLDELVRVTVRRVRVRRPAQTTLTLTQTRTLTLTLTLILTLTLTLTHIDEASRSPICSAIVAANAQRSAMRG